MNQMKYFCFLGIFLWILQSCQSRCEGDPDMRDGLNIKYHVNGNPEKIDQIKDCLLNGIELKFYLNGSIKSYGYGKAGKDEGFRVLFDSTGLYSSKQLYKDGKFVFISSLDESIVMDSNYVLRSKDYSIDLKSDSFLKRSHNSEYFIKQVNSDSIYLEAEQKTILFDKSLNIISETVLRRSY
jgi:hypothetical protein